MKLNALRCLIVASLFLVLQSSFAASPPVEFGPAMEWMFRTSEVGTSIVRRLTGIHDLIVTESTLRSFKERLRWETSERLANELRSESRILEAELEAFRTSQSRNAKLAEGETLSLEDIDFLSQRSGALRSNKLENLLKERLTFVDAYVGPRDKVPTDYGNGRKGFLIDVSTQDGEVPARPDPKYAFHAACLVEQDGDSFPGLARVCRGAHVG
jgi:hypothetical protein